MTTDPAHWWTRTAKVLSRSGLLWLALTAIALSSLVTSGAGLAPSARLIAASNVGSTSKLKANTPGAPTAFPGELSRGVLHRTQNSEAAARRILAGGMPLALLVTVAAIIPARADHAALATDSELPAIRPTPFAARAPPAIA